ncbi:hypothetical protein [Lacinutrix salivirga]
MKTRLLFSIALIFAFLACKDDTKNKVTEDESVEKRITPAAIPKIAQLPYNNNLEILKEDSDYDDNSIYLKIPVPNQNFVHVETIDVSSNSISAIVYVISDNTRNSALNKPIVEVYKDTLKIDSVLGSKKILGNELVVFVVNDHPEDFKTIKDEFVTAKKAQIAANNMLIECGIISLTKSNNNEFPEPKEACGGVIVKRN